MHTQIGPPGNVLLVAKVAQAHEVAAVGIDRMLGEPPLGTQMAEKIVSELPLPRVHGDGYTSTQRTASAHPSRSPSRARKSMLMPGWK